MLLPGFLVIKFQTLKININIISCNEFNSLHCPCFLSHFHEKQGKIICGLLYIEYLGCVTNLIKNTRH